MKIHQLRLINVKSYVDETLDFQLGINFISGINGAGKSTIIESLGYALFNYNPYVLKQFLREGSSQGEIQVLIEASDERMYRVVRKFTATASTKWEIWDEETSSMLQDLHGAEDVQSWLKEIMNIAVNEDLSDLFRQIIAVQQGQFTAPFLEPAGARTQTFDAVLKVEDFRYAFRETAFLERTFQQETVNLEQQREILASTFADALPMLETELEIVGKTQLVKTEEFKKLGAKLQSNLQLLELEEQKRMQVEGLEKSQALLEVKIKAHQDQIQTILEDLKEAKQAQEVLDTNCEGFELYEQAQKDLDRIEKQLAKRRLLEGQATSLQLELTNEQTKLKENSKRLAEDQIQVHEELTATKNKQEIVRKQLAHLENVSEELAKWLPLGTKWQTGPSTIANWLKTWRKTLDDARMHRQRIEDLGETISQIATSLEDLPQLEKELVGLGSQDSLELLKGQILQKQNELDSLLRNEEYLLQGLCPIILETCPSERVVHGLDEFFKEQKGTLEAELSRLTQERVAEEKLHERRLVLQEQLRAGENQALLLQTSKKDYDQMVQTSLMTLAKLPWAELKQVKQDLINLKIEYEEGKTALPSAVASWGLASAINLPASPPVVDLPLEPPTKGDLKDLSLWLSWEAEFNTNYEKWRDYGQAWSSQLQELQTQLATKLAVVEGEKNFHETKLRELAQKQIYLKQETQRLESERGKLAKGEVALLNLQKEIAAFGQPEQEQSSLKEKSEQHKLSYQLYQANRLGAERFEPLQVRLDQMEVQLKEFTIQFAQDGENLKNLFATYSKTKHLALETQVDAEKKEYLELNRDLQELAQENKKITERIEELKKRQKQWLELGGELAIAQEAREFSKLFRQTLREAADPIAQQYRDSLSVLATQIYRQVSNDNVRLDWGSQYELQLVDYDQGRERTRVFRQLSGGEQMTAALAIRLALMQLFSPLKIGFFDEPTTNLDRERRESLALAIQSATADFEQLFLISHDDSFDAITDTVLSLHKNPDQGSQIQ